MSWNCKIRKPNFFIIGAPKCGTTSLHSWLSDHPQIYLPVLKEPHFFSTDLAMWGRLTSCEYQELFQPAGQEHIAIGEASTHYLRSRVAVARILEHLPDARFIVCIRNPLSMVLSWHRQCLNEGVQNISDFKAAWYQREYRSTAVPIFCRDRSSLDYGEVCKIGSQLERLLNLVPREAVHIVVLDDLKNDPQSSYLAILDFLGVDDDGRRDFPVSNAASILPSLIAGVIQGAITVKRLLRIRNIGFGILPWLHEYFRKPVRPVNIDHELQLELMDYFEPEIIKLETILDRDFTTWRSWP